MTAEPIARRHSPLAGATHGSPGWLLLSERPFLAAVDVRLALDGPAAAAVESALGVALPRTVGHSAKGDACVVLTLGPDWWLVLGEGAESRLRVAVGDAVASIVDVSAQRTCIEISGPRVVSLLQHGWDQDLDSVAFPVGRCSQGLMVKAPVLMHHIAADCYRLHVRASFAWHLWTFLVDACED